MENLSNQIELVSMATKLILNNINFNIVNGTLQMPFGHFKTTVSMYRGKVQTVTMTDSQQGGGILLHQYVIGEVYYTVLDLYNMIVETSIEYEQTGMIGNYLQVAKLFTPYIETETETETK